MALSHLAKGHTYKEAHEELGVGITTIKEWKKLLNETGSLKQRPKERSTSKFHSEELKAYVSENPAATLKQISERFWLNFRCFRCASARWDHILKKGNPFMQKGTRKSEKNST
ncbi:MAG: transposase [Streptococcaceae bacterium]|jgi:transposase|nr:transposase [Streptococcaceae bacterium]